VKPRGIATAGYVARTEGFENAWKNVLAKYEWKIAEVKSKCIW
jgi:hypothetical protein